jgi:cytochrome c-type biogenesis protein CcmF
MEEVQYIGEHLWPGVIGHLAVVGGFVSSLFACVAYFLSARPKHTESSVKWKLIGRSLFALHGISTIGLIALLFYIMSAQYYEYSYVFEHVSDELPMKYIFSAFWEGQEGSFLLWMFWHIVLGGFIAFGNRTYESPVMAVLLVVQTFIASMLLGVYVPFTDLKIGSNPTLLLRQVVDAPIFQSPDYLSLIQGKGLNILLQNYWMTIHPPTLFLGFASATIPFALAIAAMLYGDHKTKLRQLMPWSLFSAGILGLGILMGAAWAYEALTFGGYWAWDPVENMSLVPWLMLVGGLHTNLVARATGHSVRSTYLFYIFSFLLVIYSTYLVRSGALEDTSVHAFTEMGLGWQLTFFLGSLLIGSLAITAIKWKSIPAKTTEEPSYSREFWMFIGALVLVISSILITYSTSLPVINKIVQIFNPTYPGQTIQEPEAHYNRYQLWVAVLIGITSSIAIQVRYHGRNWQKNKNKILTTLGISAVIGALATFLTVYFGLKNAGTGHVILLFSAYLTLVSNIHFLWKFSKFKLKMAGAGLSHVGFALLIIGILLSGLKKSYITYNPVLSGTAIAGFNEEERRTNQTLIKKWPKFMQGYYVEFERDTTIERKRSYYVRFLDIEEEALNEDPLPGQPLPVEEEFTLSPNVIYNKEFTKIEAYNPSIKRGLTRDVFTRISGLPQQEIDREFARNFDDTLSYQMHYLSIGDTLIKNGYAFLAKTITPTESISHAVEREAGDIPVQMTMDVWDLEEKEIYTVNPAIMLRGNMTFQFFEPLDELNLRFRLGDSTLLPFLAPDRLPGAVSERISSGSLYNISGCQVELVSLNKEINHPIYEAVEGDIAISALLRVRNMNTGIVYPTEAVYLIRDSREFYLDGFIPELGMSLRFEKLYPENGNIQLTVGNWGDNGYKFPVKIAFEVPRTDFISLQAIIFPGINLVWLGSLIMLGGFFISWWVKRKQSGQVTPQI